MGRKSTRPERSAGKQKQAVAVPPATQGPLPVVLENVELDFAKGGDRRLLFQKLAWGIPQRSMSGLAEQMQGIVDTASDPRCRVQAAKAIISIVGQQIQIIEKATEASPEDDDDSLAESFEEALEKAWGPAPSPDAEPGSGEVFDG